MLPAARKLTDTPWFWLMLFGCVGSLGVVVIGPKYAARVARLERMAATRAQVAAAREAGVPSSAVKRAAPTADSAPATPIEPYVDADFRRPPRLAWLLAAAIGVMLAGTAGMIVTRRRERAAAAPANLDPDERRPAP